MPKRPFRVHMQQWQSRVKPQKSAGVFARIVGWLLMGVMLILGLMFGVVLLLVGWILMLPLLWRRRRDVKQMWQFSKAARQAQHQAQQQQQQQQGNDDKHNGTTIEGEFQVKDDERRDP